MDKKNVRVFYFYDENDFLWLHKRWGWARAKVGKENTSGFRFRTSRRSGVSYRRQYGLEHFKNRKDAVGAFNQRELTNICCCLKAAANGIFFSYIIKPNFIKVDKPLLEI